jgi:hypothetical protein
MVRAAPGNRLPGRRARAVAASVSALAAVCAFAAPASAALTISSFTVQATKMVTAPGASFPAPVPIKPVAGASPDLTVDMQFSSQDGDSPKDAMVSLASGVLANPTVASYCNQADFAADNCPADTHVGQGFVTATIQQFGSITRPLEAYLLSPQGSEIADVGVVVSLFDINPPVEFEFPVSVRTSPDVGIDIPISGIPDSISNGPGTAPTSIQVNEVSLTLSGSVNGQPFTRLPTSCSGAASTVAVDSYNAPATQVGSSATLTPQSCAGLPFGPQLSASGTQGGAANNDGNYPLALTATITQPATNSAVSEIALALPTGVAVNLNAFAAICASVTAPGCQPIGTTSVTTPLLSSPLQGSLYLVRGTSLLPQIEAVIPPPFGLTLVGSPAVTPTGITATFAGIPDVPISALQVSFSGGPGGLLEATPQLCSSSPTIATTFTAQDGATATVAPTLQVQGCQPPATATLTGPGGSGSSTPTAPSTPHPSGVAKPPRASVVLSAKRPSLLVTVTAGAGAPALGSVRITLPGGVKIAGRLWPRGVTGKLDGRALSSKAISDKGGLTLTLTGKGRKLTLTLSGALLQLAKRLTAKGSHVTLTFVVVVKDTTGRSTTLRVPVVV